VKFFRLALLLGAILAFLPAIRAEEEERGPWPFGWSGDERFLLGIEGLEEENGDLQGLRLVYGTWDEAECDFNGRGYLYATVLEDGPLRVYRTGLDGGLIIFGIGPFRVVPHFALGLEYRDEDPHEGFGGTLAIGVEGAIWLGKSAQMAVAFDRKWGFPSTTRNELSVGLRWTPKRVPWLRSEQSEEKQ
jgi:hypothetical protein